MAEYEYREYPDSTAIKAVLFVTDNHGDDSVLWVLPKHSETAYGYPLRIPDAIWGGLIQTTHSAGKAWAKIREIYQNDDVLVMPYEAFMKLVDAATQPRIRGEIIIDFDSPFMCL